MSSYESVVNYFVSDFPRQLFPLDTNRILIENAAEELGKFVYKRISYEGKSKENFLPQFRTYAAKPGFHLRRTLKLDPVAEFFIYDLTYRNRTSFKKCRASGRKNYGYRFYKGKMLSPVNSFRQFRSAVHGCLARYKYCVKADIAQYFNSLYHHDLVSWFREHAKTDEDVLFFDKFFRQINVGRSVDCLPHGLYPTKIIGSQFLRFIDESNRIRAKRILRFMDDFYLFDNEEDVLKQDFQQLQRLLADKSLGLNESKTCIGEVNEVNVKNEVDEIKAQLFRKRDEVVFGSGADVEDEEFEEEILEEETLEYLMDMLRNEHLEEEDAELILSVMREHATDVMEYIPTLLRRFPALSKNVFHFSAHVDDKAELLAFIRDYVKESLFVTEYQLFWLAKLCQEYLLREKEVGEVLGLLLEHPAATVISKAKVLEIPEMRFGMPDLREEELRTGASGWLAWASAIGSRDVKKASRNHLLGYFANGSPINKLISDYVCTV